ncbi:MAG: site-specific tyrosine recombinase XerD [Chitinophagia bacterium]|nr:site-specific tyrosine recombinase XerD [Chitinophagia bacterium]
MWEAYIKGFKAYLSLERSMSSNTIEAYCRDIRMLERHLPETGVAPEAVTTPQLRHFIEVIAEMELSAATQARVLSGIKSFYRYLLLEEVITTDPTELIEAPKQSRTLPDVLSVAEIDQMFAAIDHSTPDGARNRAMLETMYSCGLRVSEVTGLLLSQLYLDIGFIKVTGKGNKERLIPIGAAAIQQVQLYLEHIRTQVHIQSGKEDYLFLSKRGAPLSRVMVFYVIRDLALKAGISKAVHPHTLRHSFATHLVEAGADIRAVQEMLGHKSITTTEIYTHLDRSYLRNTLQQFHPYYSRH